jgi:hypothetical protein
MIVETKKSVPATGQGTGPGDAVPASLLSWETLDWSTLDRLRDQFLSGTPVQGSYWNSRSDLANYDFTFAQRIGWKWDAVLAELRMRRWSPPSGPVLDWGCGSGLAGRRVVEAFGPAQCSSLRVFDHSDLAMDFAVDAAREAFPGVEVQPADAAWLASKEPIGVLVVSHVINELTEPDRAWLRQLMDRAAAILWVEPGTYADSRALIAMREAVRENFLLVAPCTHQCACGLLTSENKRHWCHHFARPPVGIMGDSNWVRFAQRAGIDLRSLPYSFLVLEQMGLRDRRPGLLLDGWSHILGEPRVYKGFARVLSCQSEGVRELELQKRDGPEVFKAMKSGESELIYRWTVTRDRIATVESLSNP